MGSRQSKKNKDIADWMSHVGNHEEKSHKDAYQFY
jgi:hypothetical protein